MARGCICCIKYMLFLFNLLFWVHTHTHTLWLIIASSVNSHAIFLCFSWAAAGCWALACGSPCLRAALPPSRPHSRRSLPPISSSPLAASSWWQAFWVAWVPLRRISAFCWAWVHYISHNALLRFKVKLNLVFLLLVFHCSVDHPVGWTYSPHPLLCLHRQGKRSLN